MFPNTMDVRVNRRTNVHSKQGVEFAIDVRLDGGDWWTIEAYDKEPSAEKLEEVAYIVKRSMEVYHASLSIPGFAF